MGAIQMRFRKCCPACGSLRIRRQTRIGGYICVACCGTFQQPSKKKTTFRCCGPGPKYLQHLNLQHLKKEVSPMKERCSWCHIFETLKLNWAPSSTFAQLSDTGPHAELNILKMKMPVNWLFLQSPHPGATWRGSYESSPSKPCSRLWHLRSWSPCPWKLPCGKYPICLLQPYPNLSILAKRRKGAGYSICCLWGIGSCGDLFAN